MLPVYITGSRKKEKYFKLKTKNPTEIQKETFHRYIATRRAILAIDVIAILQKYGLAHLGNQSPVSLWPPHH